MEGFAIIVVAIMAFVLIVWLMGKIAASIGRDAQGKTRPTNTRKASRNDLSRNSRNDDAGGCTGGSGGCSDCGGCD